MLWRSRRPAPGGVDAQSELAGAAGDAGGDVQDPVAEGFDLAAGQVGVLGEADQFGPGHQIGCGQDDFQPGGVRVERGRAGWQPGGLGLADPVLDAGVLAVAQFQPGELAGDDAGGGVGDERGDPQPVGVGEPQLRAGMGAFLAQDQPGPGRPAVRSTSAVASATQAPSRMPPSVSIAGYQPSAVLRVSTASRIRASTA